MSNKNGCLYEFDPLEIMGQPELTPFRLTNKEADLTGTISYLSTNAKKDGFTAL